jgi:DNA-binding FrmR family transcriptional regulator
MKAADRKEKALSLLLRLEGNLITLQMRLQGNPDLNDVATQVQLALTNLRTAQALLANNMELL